MHSFERAFYSGFAETRDVFLINNKKILLIYSSSVLPRYRDLQFIRVHVFCLAASRSGLSRAIYMLDSHFSIALARYFLIYSILPKNHLCDIINLNPGGAN